MIPAASSVANTGTLGGPAKTMTIMRDAMAHIMSVLTNLYSDAKLAVLREYATNALDAHREIGLARPIEVTLPSDVKPILVIEDFGVGMSTDDILNLYSSYGASTKRGTNEQTGMLGLGSKSALAYSPQFTVRSRKGGIETSALIYLNDKGEGEIKIVDTKACQGTGTRIEVPVGPKDIRAFTKAAKAIFTFWTTDEVKIKGASIPRGRDEATWTWISDNIALMPPRFMDTDTSYRYRYDPNTVRIVQGGVPYVVDKDRLSDEGKIGYDALPLSDYDVVLFAPIGSVQFTPSREALYYTNDTNAKIESLFADYRREVGRFVTEKVAKAKDKQEALRFTERYSNITPPGTDVTYKGERVPASIECHNFHTDTAKRASGKRRKNLPPLSQVEEMDLVIYNVNEGQMNDKGAYPVRVNAAGYITGTYGLVERYYNGHNQKNLLMIQGDLPEGWDWYNVKAVDATVLRPKSKRSGSAGPNKSEYQDRTWAVVGGRWGATTKVDPTDPKVVYVDADGRYKIGAAPTGWTVVMVPGNQHGRFAREFPLALTREQAVKSAAADAKVIFTEADATYQRGNLFHYQRLTPNQIKQILDPDLRTVLEWVGTKGAGVKQMDKINDDLAWLKLRADVVTAETPTYDKMEARYGHLRSIQPSHLIETLNAVYTYKYQGGTK